MILTALVPKFTRPTFPFAAGSRPLLAPHFDPTFTFFLKVFSHFLKFGRFLRTPLPIQPIFDPFSRGGAQNRFTVFIIPNFADLARVCLLRIREWTRSIHGWTRRHTKNPRMDANGHEASTDGREGTRSIKDVFSLRFSPYSRLFAFIRGCRARRKRGLRTPQASDRPLPTLSNSNHSSKSSANSAKPPNLL